MHMTAHSFLTLPVSGFNHTICNAHIFSEIFSGRLIINSIGYIAPVEFAAVIDEE